MKTLLALILTTATLSAGNVRLADYLTTRTVKTGTTRTIIVAIIQHPSSPIDLELDTKLRPEPTRVTIPAGNGVTKAEYKVGNGWRATITANGNPIDTETQTRKTGMTSIK